MVILLVIVSGFQGYMSYTAYLSLQATDLGSLYYLDQDDASSCGYISLLTMFNGG